MGMDNVVLGLRPERDQARKSADNESGLSPVHASMRARRSSALMDAWSRCCNSRLHAHARFHSIRLTPSTTHSVHPWRGSPMLEGDEEVATRLGAELRLSHPRSSGRDQRW